MSACVSLPVCLSVRLSVWAFLYLSGEEWRTWHLPLYLYSTHSTCSFYQHLKAALFHWTWSGSASKKRSEEEQHKCPDWMKQWPQMRVCLKTEIRNNYTSLEEDGNKTSRVIRPVRRGMLRYNWGNFFASWAVGVQSNTVTWLSVQMEQRSTRIMRKGAGSTSC